MIEVDINKPLDAEQTEYVFKREKFLEGIKEEKESKEFLEEIKEEDLLPRNYIIGQASEPTPYYGICERIPYCESTVTLKMYKETRRMYVEYFNKNVFCCYFSGFLGVLKCDKCSTIVDLWPCYEKRVYWIHTCMYCNNIITKKKLGLTTYQLRKDDKHLYKHIEIIK